MASGRRSGNSRESFRSHKTMRRVSRWLIISRRPTRRTALLGGQPLSKLVQSSVGRLGRRRDVATHRCLARVIVPVCCGARDALAREQAPDHSAVVWVNFALWRPHPLRLVPRDEAIGGGSSPGMRCRFAPLDTVICLCYPPFIRIEGRYGDINPPSPLKGRCRWVLPHPSHLGERSLPFIAFCKKAGGFRRLFCCLVTSKD